mmetsp:Transcript_16391/g.31047  ORF Transcript_16391/g.31047 Transcript_16391/m.31047 type:complete len:118 (-) Transcript_16391:200-553(-)
MYLSAVKITGELMLGFGHGTTTTTTTTNATDWNDATDESNGILVVSDTDSTTTVMEQLEQCFVVGSTTRSEIGLDRSMGDDDDDDDLGLSVIMDNDANDEIDILVKEVLMEFVMDEE